VDISIRRFAPIPSGQLQGRSAMALASKTVPQRAVGAARAGERRSTQSVACQANGRREALLAGAGAVVTAGAPALADDKPPENKEYTGAASPPVFRDRRKERASIDKGVYEPRRATANEKPRGEGESRFSFDKLSQKDTEERAAKSIERIENKVPDLVDRKYWQVRYLLFSFGITHGCVLVNA
jgi:photosystem II oxygen-evolving enhancer protein 3